MRASDETPQMITLSPSSLAAPVPWKSAVALACGWTQVVLRRVPCRMAAPRAFDLQEGGTRRLGDRRLQAAGGLCLLGRRALLHVVWQLRHRGRDVHPQADREYE